MSCKPVSAPLRGNAFQCPVREPRSAGWDHPSYQSRGKCAAKMMGMSHVDQGCVGGTLNTGGVWENSPESSFTATLMLTADKMEPQHLNIDTTLNQERNGAVLHINCQSDGKPRRWMEVGEEASWEQKMSWLVKLGCLLKLHGRVNCQWPHLSMEHDTSLSLPSDIFGHPWAYRIADFPRDYKLFVVERQAKGNDPPTKDCYLCGMFFLLSFLPSPDDIPDQYF